MRWLGEDAHGTWFVVPAGAAARRGHEPARQIPYGFVSLVPRDAWWEAEFYASHPRWQVYVNIGMPCEKFPGRIRQVDLDLDVVRTWEGAVEILDEDEFADHRVRFGYPPELADGARRATAEVEMMLSLRTEPFDRAADRWLKLGDRVLRAEQLVPRS
ncbi:MAG: DUF402 domain-containing protein [Chloroflexota bacterium]